MPRNRWQFSLRSLLLLTAVVSVGFAWWASRDRIPKDWDLTTIYEAAGNSFTDESYLLCWCVEADDRPLLVERCIVLAHQSYKDGDESWHLSELYRHPESTTPTWDLSMVHLGPCSSDPVGRWEMHTKRFDRVPTNAEVYQFLDDIGWKFGPSDGFKIIDSGVSVGRWKQALKEPPTRKFE